jgi:hypothetical protein
MTRKRYAKFGEYRALVIPGEYGSHWEILEFTYAEGPGWEITASGHTKWDGCVNWEAGNGSLVHGCFADHEDAGLVELFKAITWAAHTGWLVTKKRDITLPASPTAEAAP